MMTVALLPLFRPSRTKLIFEKKTARRANYGTRLIDMG